MAAETPPESDVTARGARQAVIERFGISGLYGYRSISLESEFAATILIARNGTGKTTLLGALNAFLKLQFSRLRNLEFSEIYCKLRSVEEELVLTHDDIVDFLQVPTQGELVRLASRANIDPSSLFNYLREEWDSEVQYSSELMENRVFSAIVTSSNYNYAEARQACEKIRRALFESQPNVKRISEVLSGVMSNYDIVYLPTYRRVELALSEDTREPRRRRRPKFNIASGSLFTGDIQFGLSDISDRLSELNQKIIVDSNDGYRKISANIINELIDGSFEGEEEADFELPTEDELKLFFARLEQGRRMGPYAPVSVPNMNRIYSEGGIPESSSKFLRYFLGKLSTVVRTSKEVEAPVDAFISSCNKYLLSEEPSTALSSPLDSSGMQAVGSESGKALRLNRRNLTVRVESVPEGRRISLDALSSGEKQMISLFAKIFLYPKPKIVLVDEPELSLSIDWQMQILVDVLNAPLCEQIVAITHSPFVFDNDLEKFARALKVGTTRPEQTELLLDDGELDSDD